MAVKSAMKLAEDWLVVEEEEGVGRRRPEDGKRSGEEDGGARSLLEPLGNSDGTAVEITSYYF